MIYAVFHRWLAIVFGCLLAASPVLAVQDPVSCVARDFEPYWPSVFEGYLTDILSVEEGTVNQVRGDVPYRYRRQAQAKTEVAAELFSMLLKKYPVLCQLKRMNLNQLNVALFSTLMYQQKHLIKALKRGLISAKYLSDIAIRNPHFTSNLLGLLPLLVDLTHTLEINVRQQRYFSRIAYSLVREDDVSGDALRVYSQAFSHMVLLINEGYSDEFLEEYSATISSLREDQFEYFFQLDQTSTAGIQGFIAQFEYVMHHSQNSTAGNLTLPIQLEYACRRLSVGQGNAPKIEVCGNVAFYKPANESYVLEY